MNKPDIQLMRPGPPATNGQGASLPNALVHQTAPANSVGSRTAVPPTRPAQQAGGPEYVDPYLFETGYYASQAEYQALSSTATSRIQLRAEAENARPKRRKA